MNSIYKEVKAPAALTMLTLIGDLAGCGTIRVIYPSLLVNQFRQEIQRPDGSIAPITFEGHFTSFFVNDPTYYKPLTFVQFQRASSTYHLDMIKLFRERFRSATNTPMIYEIDDLLYDIAPWNYAYDHYKDLKNNLIECMKLCDAIVVSTERLKKEYSKYNSKIKVAPNHLPKFIWGDVKFNAIHNNKKPRIIYHGSFNHFATTQIANKGILGGDFGNELLNFIRKTVDEYQWVFVGGFPLELNDIKHKIEYHGWKNILEFPSFIKNLNLDLGIVSLEKSKFNECKSNIKMLEYAAMGVPAVYTNIEPYKNATYRSNSDEEMIEHIKILISDEELKYKAWNKDYNSIKSQLFWEDSNNVKKYINTYLNLFGRKLPK